jgi:hypothetical protein
MYNLTEDFPNLPRQHTQTQRKQPPTENTNHNGESSTAATSQLTQATFEKLQDGMHQQFTAMIQKEVKQQIKEEMTVMQAEMAQLSHKIENMSGDIQSSIGTTV